MTTTKALVERILAGDKEAFRVIVAEHQRLVGHIVFRMIHSPADHADLCQEVFIKVYQHLESFRFQAKLSTWIGRIAYTSCLNFLDKKKESLYDDIPAGKQLAEEAGDNTDHPGHRLENEETALMVRRQIDRLPPVYRTAITLFHLEQMNYEEIADIMDMPIGTIKSHLFRGRRLLKELMLSRYSREDM